MIIDAKITGIKYSPLLCNKLNIYEFNNFDKALEKDSSFILNVNNNEVAISWWVSPKRTRSYPFARVYNTLGHVGKKITIIPFVKDEGKDGDRDFIQWDTISLMSLLGVNVIIAYYCDADKNSSYDNKITNQKYDIDYLKNEILKNLSYQSDALHWNIEQIDKIAEIAEISKKEYDNVSKKTGVILHSSNEIDRRITIIKENKDNFMNNSRNMAINAQKREIITIQPKEYLSNGIKAQINIKNYLGGIYYLTSDEAKIEEDKILIIEGKHTKSDIIPKIDDIKDGLLKMILYTNLKDVTIEDKQYLPIPILKLTSDNQYDYNKLNLKQKENLEILKNEAKMNNFNLLLPKGQ